MCKKKIATLIKIAFLLLLAACNDNSNTETKQFNSLSLELQRYNYADYDSLVFFYRRVDSVNSIHPSVYLGYLKKNIESRLNSRAGNFNKSNKNLLESNSFVLGLANSDTLLANNYMLIGINQMLTGVFDSAFYYFLLSETIFDSLQNKNRLNAVYGNMAKAYYNKGESVKSMQYIDKIINDSVNIPLLLTMWHLKANILGSEGMLDSALLIDRNIIAKFEKSQNGYLISSFYNNMGMCFLEKNMIDSALYYCKKSYRLDSLSGFDMNMGANLLLLADIYYENGDHRQANDYYNRALKLFSKGNNADKKILVFEALAKNATNEGNYKLVSQYKDSILFTHQRINSIEVNRAIERLHIEYESDKKNQQIIAQEKQLKIQRIAIIFIAIVALLVVAIFYFFIQYRDKINKLKMVEQDRKFLSLQVLTEKSERARIARDLHDSVNQKLAVVQMSVSLLETIDTKTIVSISGLLKDISLEIRAISRNLHPKDIEKGIVPALETLCEQNNMLQNDIYFSLDIRNWTCKGSENNNIDFVLYRIVQEITSNALKYSKADKIDVNLAYKEGKILLEIFDNGVGFDMQVLENTKGIGLRNIFDRVKQINGTIDLKTGENIGTKFTVEIPF